MSNVNLLDPSKLKLTLVDASGANLKKTLVTDKYTGGTPADPAHVKAVLINQQTLDLKKTLTNEAGTELKKTLLRTTTGPVIPPDPTQFLDNLELCCAGYNNLTVSQWDDMSGNDRHMLQASAPNQPTIETMGNASAARFDTSVNHQYMQTASTIVNGTVFPGDWSIWACVRYDAAQTFGRFFQVNDLAAELRQDSGLGTRGEYRHGSVTSTGTTNCVGSVCCIAGVSESGTGTLYVDQAVEDSDADNWNKSSSNWVVGGRRNGGGTGSRTTIGAVVATSEALNAIDLQNLQRWAEYWWGATAPAPIVGYFDGSTHWITSGSNLGIGGASTVEFEATIENTGTTSGYVLSAAFGGNSGIGIQQYSGGICRCYCRVDGDSAFIDANIPAGEMATIRVVYDGVNMSAYKDGGLVNSIPKSGTVESAGDFVVGQFGSGAIWHEGQVKDVSLTVNGSKVLDWPINEGSGTNIADTSGNGNTGTLIGDPGTFWRAQG